MQPDNNPVVQQTPPILPVVPPVEIVQTAPPPVLPLNQNPPPVSRGISKKVIIIAIILIILAILLTVLFFINSKKSVSPATIKSNSGETPITDNNYTLQKCGNTDLHLLMPNNWFYKPETVGDTEACFITKEKLTTSDDVFKTGISVNRLTNISQKRSMTANEYAEAYIDLIETNAQKYGFVKVDKVVSTNSSFPTWARYAQANDFKMYFLALVDEANDTVYIITFESPIATWDQEFPVAEKVLSNIAIVSK